MKHSNIEDRLALVAALIVLIGVSMAAGEALADDTRITSTAETLDLENRNDLDIRLGDHTSVLIAGRD